MEIDNIIIIIVKDVNIVKNLHPSFIMVHAVHVQLEPIMMQFNKDAYHALKHISIIQLQEIVYVHKIDHIQKMEDVLHVLHLDYGMESIVFHVLKHKFIILLRINANVQPHFLI